MRFITRSIIAMSVWSIFVFASQVAVGAPVIIVRDNYNVTTTNSGFALDAGVNAGINPPTTRLTGTAANNLRYIQTDAKTATAFTIVSNKVLVTPAANPGRMVLSADGVSSFDFGPVLGATTASPSNPVVYDIAIRMNNDSPGTERFSFAIASMEGSAGVWDFGMQLYRASSANNFYTIAKRINPPSSGLASHLNKAITTMTGTSYGMDINFLIRVTDAGAETTAFNSRVQVSWNGGNSWFYDTALDPDLPNGWRFDGPGRHIMWDVAPDAGPVTYDAFTLRRDPPQNVANTNSMFKAVAYNIHFAAQDGKVNTQRIADFILAQNADLVALNEVDRFKDRSNDRDLIAELGVETGYNYIYGNNTPGSPGQVGNAILSRYPIMTTEQVLLPRVADNEQRGLLKTVVDVNGKFVAFWATHLDFRADNTERLMCVTNFNTWVGEETIPVIIAGDFNATPDEVTHTRMELKWNDAWLLAGDGTLGRTVPSPGVAKARIDYIWRAKTATSLVPTNAFVGYGIDTSDHYPVVSHFIVTNFHNYARGFYFPANAGSGTRVTDSIAGLSGPLGGSAGPTWSTNSPTGLAGDHSLYFDGTRSFTITDTNQVIGTNGFNDNYTIQAWVKLPANYSAASRAVLFQYERRPGFAISITPGRALHTTAFRNGNYTSSATIPDDGAWHHVAVVHNDAANFQFYIDGELKGTTTFTNRAGFRTSSVITIGANEAGTNVFNGWMTRFGFENRALAPEEFDFPAVPQLKVRRDGANVVISWRKGQLNHGLQFNNALQSTGWTTLATQANGDELQATVAPSATSRFYRLIRQ